eukprot:4472910-Prymnesium_polylepis.1
MAWKHAGSHSERWRCCASLPRCLWPTTPRRPCTLARTASRSTRTQRPRATPSEEINNCSKRVWREVCTGRARTAWRGWHGPSPDGSSCRLGPPHSPEYPEYRNITRIRRISGMRRIPGTSSS